jgi:hypothetical protein
MTTPHEIAASFVALIVRQPPSPRLCIRLSCHSKRRLRRSVQHRHLLPWILHRPTNMRRTWPRAGQGACVPPPSIFLYFDSNHRPRTSVQHRHHLLSTVYHPTSMRTCEKKRARAGQGACQPPPSISVYSNSKCSPRMLYGTLPVSISPQYSLTAPMWPVSCARANLRTDRLIT